MRNRGEEICGNTGRIEGREKLREKRRGNEERERETEKVEEG